MTIFTIENNTKQLKNATLERWREAKSEMDTPVKDILGCVGESLVPFIPDTVAGREAATTARERLLDLVNEQRESAAEDFGGEIYQRLEYLDSEDIRDELSSSDSPDDAADKAFVHAAHVVMHDCYHATEISDEALG